MDSIHIPEIPHSLHWLNPPESWDLSAEGQLTFTSPARSDWFIDPQGAVRLHRFLSDDPLRAAPADRAALRVIIL